MSDKETLPLHPGDKISPKIVGIPETLSLESTGVLSDIAAGADQFAENHSKSSDSKESNNNNDKSRSRGNSKEGKGFFRLSKFLSRNRIIIGPGSKEPEETSIGSSNTVKTGSSSVSNESRTNYSSRVPSRMSSIGSHFRRLMRFKSSQRNVKTEEQIVVVPSVEPFPVISDDGGIASDFDQRSQRPYDEDYDSKNVDERVAAVAEKLSEISKTTPVIIDDAVGPPLLRSSTMTTEDVVIGNSATTIPLISSTVTITNPRVQQRSSGNDTSTMIVADKFDVMDAANLEGAEVHVQLDRRTHDAPEIRSDHFIYPQQSEESRVEPNVTQNRAESRRQVERNGSIIGTVGSESSSVISEVADPNEQQQQLSEGRDDDDVVDDAADQYYNAVLRAVLRKQFRHHDDEPPIY